MLIFFTIHIKHEILDNLTINNNCSFYNFIRYAGNTVCSILTTIFKYL